MQPANGALSPPETETEHRPEICHPRLMSGSLQVAFERAAVGRASARQWREGEQDEGEERRERRGRERERGRVVALRRLSPRWRIMT